MSTASLSLIQSESSVIEQKDEVSKATSIHLRNKTNKRIRSLRFLVDPQKLELKNVFSQNQNVSSRQIEMDELVFSLVSAICLKKQSLSQLQLSDIDDDQIATNQKEKINKYKKKKKKKHSKNNPKLRKKHKSVNDVMPQRLKLQRVDTEMYGKPTPKLGKKYKTVNILSIPDHHELNIINELEDLEQLQTDHDIAKYGKSKSAPFSFKQSNSKSHKHQLKKRRKRAKTMKTNIKVTYQNGYILNRYKKKTNFMDHWGDNKFNIVDYDECQ